MTGTSLFDPSNSPGALIDPNTLGASLRTSAAQVVQQGGRPFLKMRKDGGWEYGPNSVPVTAADEWAINFATFKAGLIGWKGGNVVGEHMFPIGHPEKIDPESLEPINTGKKSDGWKEQVSVEMKNVRDGTEVLYKTTSYGGKQLAGKLMEVIGNQLAEKPDFPIVVVRLGSADYKHPEYGQTWNPTFEVLRWLDQNGQPEGSAAATPTPKTLV